MTLGEKITSLRNTYKLSQGDLAEKLNVSRQSVSKWETGTSVPELDKLIMMNAISASTISLAGMIFSFCHRLCIR